MKSHLFLLGIVVLCLGLKAQNEIILPTNVKASYATGVRNRDGTPGHEYWQNHGDYVIDVSFDPQTRMVSGSEVVIYHNDSPNPLNEMVLGLYQEVLSKNTRRLQNLRIDSFKDETVIVESLKINGHAVDMKKKTSKRGTNLFIQLEQPVGARSQVVLEVKWHYQMLKDFQLRTGDRGNGVVFVGYFYPKVAVYDDVDGWDRKDYNTVHEFYSDFGQYDVKITVPSGYIVSATGRLQNSEEVLTPKFEKRYRKALHSSEVVAIVGESDLKTGGITRGAASLTWKYHAPLSPDFSFSVCKDVQWDGSIVKLKSKNVFVDAVYKPESKDFHRVAKVAAEAVKFLSEEFPGVDYPYTDMTIVNGWAAMEFAMMVNDPSVAREETLYQLTIHEIGHTYFPFFIGTNERKYAWMDEAWANIFPVFYFESHPEIENDYVHFKLDRYYNIAGKEEALPIMTLTNYLEYYPAYRHASYSKSSYALLCLRDFIGKEVFAKRLKNYFKNWGFKHPIPYDFFGAFNPKNNDDINWFYQQFYFLNTYADLTLKYEKKRLSVVNVGGLPLGFEVRFTLKDGRNVKRSLGALVWKGKREYVLTIPANAVAVSLVNQWKLDVDLQGNQLQL